MKNKTLFIVLVALFGVTYFFEEHLPQKNEDQKEKAFLDEQKKLGALLSLELKNAKLTKEGTELRAEDLSFSLDKEKLHYFLESIAALKIIKEFKKEEVGKIKDRFLLEKPVWVKFVFENETKEYFLGLKHPLDETFYIQLKEKGLTRWLLVKDERPYEGLYHMGVRPEDMKYHRFKEILSLNDESFLDKKVLRDSFESSQVEAIVFDSQLHGTFTADYQKRTTYPEAFQNIPYDQEYFLKYLDAIKNLEVKEHLTSDIKSDHFGSVSIGLKNGDFIELNIFKKDNQFFLSFNDHTFSLSNKYAFLLLKNVQDFWDKRIILDSEKLKYAGLQTEKINLSDGKKIKTLYIPKSQEFIVKNEYQVRLQKRAEKRVEELVNMVLGGAHSIPMHRVSSGPLAQNFKRMMGVNWLGLSLDLFIMNDEVIIRDEERDLNFHFLNLKMIDFKRFKDLF